MAYTSPRTWSAGELVTASMMNTHIRDNQNFFAGLINTTTGNLEANASTGPHAIGTTASTSYQLTLGGSYTSGSDTVIGMLFNHTLTPAAAGGELYGTYLAPTINDYASGTTIRAATLFLAAPQGLAGGSTITTAATLYIASVPSAGASNYALYINAGDVSMAGAAKLFLRGSGNYIYSGTTDRIDIFTGGALGAYFRTAAGVSGVLSDWAMPAAKQSFPDGGGDTYWYEGSPNVQAWVCGGLETLQLGSATGAVFNAAGNAALDFRVAGDTMTHAIFLDATNSTENIALLASAAPNWQTMDKGIFIGDVQSLSTGNPVSGGFFYAQSGALKWRGSSGTITTIAVA